MKLKNIKISNYRCFKEAEIDFDDHITLVVGKNGADKTAILDAVAVSVSTFLLGIDGGVSSSIFTYDARFEFHDLHGTIDSQHQFQVSIESIGDCLNQQNVKWIRSLNSESGKTTIKDFHAIFPEVQFIVSSHAPAVINSVPREQIRILEHGGIYMSASQTYGRDRDITDTRLSQNSEKILGGDIVCA